MQWFRANEITRYPMYHSSAMTFVKLLVAVKGTDSPQMGRYLGGLINEFRVDGSNSTQDVTHWMPLPKMPSVVHWSEKLAEEGPTSLDVDCPVCSSPAGERCINRIDRTPLHGVHIGRNRASFKKDKK